jgi:hypothetical protein
MPFNTDTLIYALTFGGTLVVALLMFIGQLRPAHKVVQDGLLRTVRVGWRGGRIPPLPHAAQAGISQKFLHRTRASLVQPRPLVQGRANQYYQVPYVFPQRTRTSVG